MRNENPGDWLMVYRRQKPTKQNDTREAKVLLIQEGHWEPHSGSPLDSFLLAAIPFLKMVKNITTNNRSKKDVYIPVSISLLLAIYN